MQSSTFFNFTQSPFVPNLYVPGAGVLPLLGVRRGWLSPSETAQSPLVRVLLSAGICFGGGVILTSCLTHMLPDVNEVRIVNLKVNRGVHTN